MEKIQEINLQAFLTIAAVRCTCVALFSISHKQLEMKLRVSNLGVFHKVSSLLINQLFMTTPTESYI